MSTKAVSASNKGSFQPDSDVHISFEDQQRINIFAKHNANIEDLKQELKIKQNSLKNLEDANDEIELFDEEEPIPILIGDVFITHNLEQTTSFIGDAKAEIQKGIKEIETKISEIQEKMSELKGHLYSRFGNHIYLENEE